VFLYYAYLLGPPVGDTHTIFCTASSCTFSVVAETGYSLKHLSQPEPDCEGCTDALRQFTGKLSDCGTSWRPDLSLICDILAKGGIPLIVAANPPMSGSDMELSITEYVDGMEYIALSHVWAHGRGNPCTNESPLCQVAHIFNKAAQMSNSASRVCIWTDTPCIPLTPVKARNQAIVKHANRILKSPSSSGTRSSFLEESRMPFSHL
jgi:hypothetical protein